MILWDLIFCNFANNFKLYGINNLFFLSIRVKTISNSKKFTKIKKIF